MPYRDDLRALEDRRDALEAELRAVRREIDLRRPPLLPAPRIASPCSVPWSSMEGDDRVRLCRQCAKYVYNVSAMTRAEAAELFAREPRLCVRYFEREDGTILTSDCALGARARRMRRVKAVAPAAIVAASVAALSVGTTRTPAPVYLLSVDEILAHRPRSEVRAEGKLVHGSIEKRPTETRFALATNGVEMPVRYRSTVVPDTFQDLPDVEVTAIVEGQLEDDGVFRADTMLVKAPNQGYRMK